MQISRNTSKSGGSREEREEGRELLKWYDRPWAALMFFTRLPLWRLHEPPAIAFRSVVEWWPLAGWLTGAVMASVLYLGSHVSTYPIAILLAIVSRLLLTGALHEDGLADFFDGFGGGTERTRILAIMKDSHIGTYGVLALVVYVCLLFFALFSMPPMYAALTIFLADPYAKMLAAQIVSLLPYARDEQTAKSHVVYRKFSLWTGVGLFLQGILPMIACYIVMGDMAMWGLVIFVPVLVMTSLYIYVRARLGGYTGDCCGALFLLTELSVYLVMSFCLNPSFFL